MQKEGKQIGRQTLRIPWKPRGRKGSGERSVDDKQGPMVGERAASRQPVWNEWHVSPQYVLQRCGKRCAEEVDQSNASQMFSAPYVIAVHRVGHGLWLDRPRELEPARVGSGEWRKTTSWRRVPFGRMANASCGVKKSSTRGGTSGTRWRDSVNGKVEG